MSSKVLLNVKVIYSWWLTSFEFVGILFSLYALLVDSKRKIGAVGMLAVLTVSMFVACHEMWSDLRGLIYKTNNYGYSTAFHSPRLYHSQVERSQITLFAGAVTCSIGNALLVLTLADEQGPESETAVKAAVDSIEAAAPEGAEA